MIGQTLKLHIIVTFEFLVFSMIFRKDCFVWMMVFRTILGILAKIKTNCLKKVTSRCRCSNFNFPIQQKAIFHLFTYFFEFKRSKNILIPNRCLYYNLYIRNIYDKSKNNIHGWWIWGTSRILRRERRLFICAL